MNNLLATFAILCCTIYQTSAHTIPGGVKVEKSTITVATSKWNAESIHLEIKDMYGTKIVDEQLYSVLGDKVYDLQRMPKGQYVMTTSDNHKVEELVFSVDHDGIHTEMQTTVYNKPSVYYRDGVLDVQFLTGDLPAIVSIYDESARKVRTIALAGGDVHEQIKLRGLSRGKYVVHVANTKVHRTIAIKK